MSEPPFADFADPATIPDNLTDFTTIGDDTFVVRFDRRLPTDAAAVKTTVFLFGGIVFVYSI